MSLYRKDIFQGGWFSFHSKVEDWVEVSKKLREAFFKSFMFDEVFGKTKTTDELFIKSNLFKISLYVLYFSTNFLASFFCCFCELSNLHEFLLDHDFWR